MSAFWTALFALIADYTPENYGESNGKLFAMFDGGTIVVSLFAKIMLYLLNCVLYSLSLVVLEFCQD